MNVNRSYSFLTEPKSRYFGRGIGQEGLAHCCYNLACDANSERLVYHTLYPHTCEGKKSTYGDSNTAAIGIYNVVRGKIHEEIDSHVDKGYGID